MFLCLLIIKYATHMKQLIERRKLFKKVSAGKKVKYSDIFAIIHRMLND